MTDPEWEIQMLGDISGQQGWVPGPPHPGVLTVISRALCQLTKGSPYNLSSGR